MSLWRLTLALYLLQSDLIPGSIIYPDDWMVPFRAWAGAIVKFLIDNTQPVTRFAEVRP